MTETWDKRVNHYLIPFFLSILALSYHLYFFRYWEFDPLDEGYLVYGGKIVLEGKILYRDFFTMYSPGFFYLPALLYKIFGLSLVPTRVMLVFFLTATSIVAWYISFSLTRSRLFSFIPSLLITFYGGMHYTIFFGYHRTFFGLLALIPLIDVNLMSRKRLITLSFLSALSLLFSSEVGTSALIGILSFLCLYHLLSLHAGPISLTQRWKLLIQDILCFAIGISVFLIPVLLYFASQSALNEMLYDLFVYPVKVHRLTMGLPYPGITFGLSQGLLFYLLRGGFTYYLSFLVYPTTLVILLRRVYKQKEFAHDVLFLSSLLVYGIVLFQSALVRSDFAHLIFCLSPVYILGTYLINMSRERIIKFKGVSFCGDALITLLLFLVSITPVIGELANLKINDPREGKQFLSLPRGQVYVEHQWVDSLNQLAEFFEKNGREGESIFVVPYVPLIYFLFNRENPTKYNLLFMVGEDNDRQQKEIIEKLKRSKPRFVIYSHVHLVDGKWVEDSLDGKRFGDYADLLKRYIEEHYRLEKGPTFFQVWKLLPLR